MRSIRPLLAVALLAACASPGASTPSAPASDPARSSGPSEAAPSAEASAKEGGSGVFDWPDGDQPTVTRALTGIDESYINPGAVIDHDGTLHMFANVFTAWPGTVQVAHLTSADGASWELASPEPILTTQDLPFGSAGHDVSTGFVTEDGTWILVFNTVTGTEPWVIGLATAPGPDGPWTVLPEPVLTAGGAEGDEAGGLTWPSVVTTDDGFAMYFTQARDPHRGGPIGMATSTDGLTWTRRDEPVLTADVDSWELTTLDRPRVVRTDAGYVMVYAGRNLTDRGLATSPDGITWTRVGDAPAITKADFPVAGDAWDAALVHRDGVLTYYLEIGFATSTGTEIYRATAPAP
jgi:predicted GH43/DUF377 family glycosyl hydrolase